MGGFDPPPRVFQTRALPTELHDHGAGPGTRTRINWATKPAPIPLGPAGITPGDAHAASSGRDPSSTRTRRSVGAPESCVVSTGGGFVASSLGTSIPSSGATSVS